MKSLLEAVGRLPPRDAEVVRDRLGPAALAAIDDATGVDWLPAQLNLDLTLALHAALGDPRFGRFFRQELARAFSGPLLKVIVEAALRVFHADAAAFAGWVGRGWPLLFRDCGSWIVERAGVREAVVRVHDLPPAFVNDVWLRSVGHSLDAFWDLARVRGTVTLTASDPQQRTATYRIAWS
jgi:hypothetical protein